MTKKYSKRKGKPNRIGLARGTKHSKQLKDSFENSPPIHPIPSFFKLSSEFIPNDLSPERINEKQGRVTPVPEDFKLSSEFQPIKLSPKRHKLNISNETINKRKSKVLPLLEFPIPIPSNSIPDPNPIFSPYSSISPQVMRLVFDDDIVQSNIPISVSDDIDKSGRYKEYIIQRNSKENNPYDIEAPNPFWSNSNDDYGQYVELSKSSSPNLGRGVTKRKYRRHHKRTSKRTSKRSNKKNKKHSKK